MKTLLVLIIFLIQSNLPAAIKDIKKDMKVLAGKKFEGRRVGAKGNALTVDFLEKEIKKLGLKPLEKTYRQEFTIFTKMIKNGDNFLTLMGEKQVFEPLAFSSSGNLRDTPIVFVGFGISIPTTDPDLIYDDYEKIDVKDKIVILFSGDPGVGNLNSKFRNPKYYPYRSLYYKIKNASNHGAKGVLIVENPLSLTDTNEKDPFFNESEGGGAQFSILSGNVKNIFLNKLLLGSSFNNSVELQKYLSLEQKPYSFQFSQKTTLIVSLKKETGRVANVMGYIPGKMKETLVVGAHLDHLGFGGHTSMDTSHEKKIHFGADDNASGCSLLLELLRHLKGISLERNLVVVFFNGEEVGLLGSDHFVKSWTPFEENLGSISMMLNFDMVGRYSKNVDIMGLNSGFEWKEYLETFLSSPSSRGALEFKFQNMAFGSSDHASFIQGNIPSLFFTTGTHDDYHRPTDTYEKINYKALSNLTTTVKNFIVYLQSKPGPKFNPESLKDLGGNGENRGYGSHLGCVPSFSSDVEGVLCTRISANSPAEKAGLQAEDIIVHIGEIAIKNLYDLSFALKYYRPGDKVSLQWKRKQSVLESEIILTKKE